MGTQLQHKRAITIKARHKLIAKFFFPLIIFFIINLIMSVASAQVAGVKPPKGGFAIDGDLKANTPVSGNSFAPNQGDWIFGPNGSGDSVIRYNGTPFNPLLTGHVTDFYHGNDNIFASGSKFNDYISALQWTPAGSAPDKDDINNGLYHVSADSINGDQWLFIAGDRLSVKGTSYIDFELLQDSIKMVTISSTEHRFIGYGPDGGRRSGDINISMSYTNGGTKPAVTIYRWSANADSTQWFWDSIGSTAITHAFAETNRLGMVDVPFGAFGSQTYLQCAFVEAGINITELLSSAGNCAGINIHTVWIKTKASASATAALKDFIDPIPVELNFGEVSITPVSPVCIDANAITLQASPSGGTFSGDGVTGTSFSPSNAGTGMHVITYTATLGIGCVKSDTIHITVRPLPSAAVSGTTAVCKDDAAPYVVLTGSGGTRPYTFTYNINSGGNLTQTTKGVYDTVKIAVPTGTVGTFTYTLTGVADAHCSDTASGNAIITINPLPTADAGSTPAAQCYVATGNTFNLSGSKSDGNASWDIYSQPAGWTVDITNGTTISPSVKVTGAGTGGSVIMRLTVNSNTTPSCGSAVDTVRLTIKAQENGPGVNYIPPACDENTFSITVNNLQESDIVTIKDKTGAVIGALTPSSPYTVPASTTSKTFSGIPAGYGYQVSLSRGGCVSLPTNCVSATSTIKVVEKPGIQSIETANDKMRVNAYPNPFNDRVRFVITSVEAGNGSLELFNLMGQKMATVYEGYINAGSQSFEMNLPKKQQATLIYVFTLGNKKVTGKLLQLN